jgi:hypothetical protein
MAWLEWIEGTAVASTLRDSIWLYPIVESVHILALALLVGSAAMWDLRLLGVSRRLAVSSLAVHLLSGARVGFAVAVASGLLLFSVDAVSLAGNRAFQVKLVVIAAAVANAGVFHARTFPSVHHWDQWADPPSGARVAAALSLLLWSVAVVAGRFIAYL